MTSLTTPSGTSTFTYNGLGMRVGKTDSTGTYNYLCDGTSAGSPVLADGAAVYTAGFSDHRGNASTFSHDDLLGSLRFLTTGQSVTMNLLPDAFGETVSQAGSLLTPFGWNGGNGCQTEADTGLVLMGHRYYDTRIGRFISQDPAGSGGNWYAYADNNPVNETDPTGLFTPPYSNHSVDSADGTGQVFIGDSAGLAGFDGYWTNGAGTMTLKDEHGQPYVANQYEGHTSWIADDYNPFNWDIPVPKFFQDKLNKMVDDAWRLDKEDAEIGVGLTLGLYGNKPTVTKRQTNTSASGGRAAAKSLFRKLSKGKKVIIDKARDGSPRNYTEDGSVQIRMKSNGDTNVDIQGPSGKEDVHFSP